MDAVDPGSDDEELARVAAALGMRPAPKVARPAKKAPAKRTQPAKPARKTAVKKAVKKAQPSKTAAKKAPAKKAVTKASKKAPAKRMPRKTVARRTDIHPDNIRDSGLPEVVQAELLGDGVPDPVVPDPELEYDSRPGRAHGLWVQGMPWEEICLRTGYPSAHSASAAVSAWLQRGVIDAGVETNKARIQAAMETTLRVKNAFWDEAMAGDKQAAALVLKANEDFYRFAGLEKADLTVHSKQTIVISGGPNMAAELREAALKDEAERQAAIGRAEGITDVGDDVG